MAARKMAISTPPAVPLERTSRFNSLPSCIMISVPFLRRIKEFRRSFDSDTSASVGSSVPITARSVLSRTSFFIPDRRREGSISGYAKRQFRRPNFFFSCFGSIARGVISVSLAAHFSYLFIYAVSTQIPEPFCIEMVPGFSFMWIKLLSQFDIFQDFRLQYLYILLVINNQWYRIDVGKHTGQLCYLCLRHFAEAIHYLNIT